RVELVQDWTSNRATLKRALNRLTTGMFTHFNDALFLAAREQLSSVTGRKAIIVLTDGIDSGRGGVRFEKAFRSVVEEEVPVYVLSKTRIQSNHEREQLRFYERSNSALNGTRIDGIRLTLGELEASERNLARLAEETGGRLFLPDRFDQLDEVYQQVADELRSQYLIFYTPSDSARDGQYRSVKVRVRPPRLQVTTRFGYYAR
ncbi:MAG: VWA domain-containing protein, partial [Acidobacteria bacterium]|nr:VWA domain-containing protein [Acidobacteriota bacterium]